MTVATAQAGPLTGEALIPRQFTDGYEPRDADEILTRDHVDVTTSWLVSQYLRASARSQGRPLSESETASATIWASRAEMAKVVERIAGLDADPAGPEHSPEQA